MAGRTLRLVSILTRAIVSIAALAIGAAILAFFIATREETTASHPVVEPVGLQAIQPTPVDVYREWRGYGTVDVIRSVDVPARVTGVVIELPDGIEAGEPVARGQLLVALDPTDFEEEIAVLTEQIKDLDAQREQTDLDEEGIERRLELAQREVDLANRELDRLLNMVDEAGALEFELDRARATLAQRQRARWLVQDELDRIGPQRQSIDARRRSLEARKRIAGLNLERTTIEAPLAGRLEAVDVEEGEQVVSGTRIARIVDLSRVEIPLRLPASDRPLIEVGQNVSIVSTGEREQQWQGEIHRISPGDDPGTRTFSVFVEVEQDPAGAGLLTPGRYVSGVVRALESERRIVVPRRSISDQRMLIIRDGIIHSIPVDVDYFVNQRIDAMHMEGETYWAVLNTDVPDDAYVVLDATTTVPLGGRAEASIVNGSGGTAIASDGQESES